MAKRSRKSRKARAQVPSTPATSRPVAAKNSDNGAAIDFTEDYYYVFTDMRMMLIVTVLMVALMVGLSYVI